MKKRFALSLVLLFLAGCAKTTPEVSSSLLPSSSLSTSLSSAHEEPLPEPSSSPVSSSSGSSKTTSPSSVSSRPSSSTSSSSRSSSSTSSYHDGNDVGSYYQNVYGTGRELFDRIHTRMNSGFRTLGYDGLLSVYPESDSNPDGTIHDYYSKTTHYTMKDANANYHREGDSFNREHSIPKSWWGGSKSDQGCDLYIVVPTDGYVNNRRSNFPFGLTDGETYKSNGNYCRLGSSKIASYHTTDVFEPGDDKKGDFARIYFYALTKWNNSWNWRQGNGGSTFSGSLDVNTGLTDYALNLFLSWHSQDPVDDYERRKNDVGQRHQGNRNPFVDHPEWVSSIWGGSYQEKAPTSIELSASSSSMSIGETLALSLTVSPNNASRSVIYSSSNPEVASVTDDGVVKALYSGLTTIEATSTVDSTIKGSIEIEVVEPPHVDLLSISASDIALEEGESASIEVETNPSSVYPIPSYRFLSNDEGVATVSDDGEVVAVAPGETTVSIIATQGGITLSHTIKVSVSENASGYKKATSLGEGRYLLVAENEGRLLKADEVEGKKNNGDQVNVTIEDDRIDGDYETYEFTLKKEANGYSIAKPDGRYIYASSSGGFDVSDEAKAHEISISSEETLIKYGNLVLRYNSGYFRYYSNSTQGSSVSLYKAN